MKSLMKTVVYPISGLVLFVLSLVMILAMKGKLNAESLSGLPIVGGAAQARGRGEGGTRVPTVATMRYFSSEELSGMLKEARAAKEKAETEAAELSQRHKRIEMLMAELGDEKEELLRLRGELNAEREELNKTESALAKRMIEVDEVQAGGLKRSAAIHEAMDPKKAAAAIAALDIKEGAKLLAFIQEKKAARILEEITPEAASKLLSLVERVKADTGGDND